MEMHFIARSYLHHTSLCTDWHLDYR